MEKSARILHLEDDPDDAELLRSVLSAEGVRCRMLVVSGREEFAAALKSETFDLIISDYNLPAFDGNSALSIARSLKPEIPFMFVSGTIGEEAAVKALLDGATDYILKNNLKRLGASVRRILEEAEGKRRQRETEQSLRLSESQLLQARKMEAVGRLAGGVAHDFNNILTVIQSCAIFLGDRLSGDAEAGEDVATIREAADRAAALTRQLLAFGRRQARELLVLDFNAVVGNLDKILRRLVGEHIECSVRLEDALGAIRADQAQMEQVLLNLVVNARDAMPGGGALVVETANARLGASQKDWVRLAVIDTGTGMDEETKARTFEPFFTTKTKDQGTGLGLSTVYGIAEQNGGFVDIESEPGRGCTVAVYLPRVHEAASTPARVRKRGLPGGSETILLVEDDAAVRRALRRILERKGYAVLEAGDGEEALAVAAGGAGSIDLLLTDVVMPRLGGSRLSERLTAARPGMKTLFMSGYPDDVVEHHGVLREGVAFVQKPFLPSTLLRKLRAVLDRRGGAP